jgi:ABC-type transporter Mla subunit MlaD
MTTTVFNLSAVDRIEALCGPIHNDTQAIVETLTTQAQAIAAQGAALATLAKTINDLIASLGGGDQPSIDAAVAALKDVTTSLAAAVSRDQP